MSEDKKFSIFTQKFKLLSCIREFFLKEGFIDVLTPVAVKNPGMETHIHPFKLEKSEYFLHTSPEFHMKELLSLGFEKIFTMTYCFRDEPSSPLHRFQFIMLEWYRTHAHYTKIMNDTENLLKFCLQRFEKDIPQFQRATVSEVFLDFLQFDILDFLNVQDLKEKIKKDFIHIPLGDTTKTLEWDDYFFLLFLNEIEPKLKSIPYLLLYEFPYHLSALSTLKKDDPRVCERFEVFLNGVELCNCFNELTNLEEQKIRFEKQRKQKKALYGYELPPPDVLYDSLSRGLPQSSGIALGVERLLLYLTNLKEVFWY